MTTFRAYIATKQFFQNLASVFSPSTGLEPAHPHEIKATQKNLVPKPFSAEETLETVLRINDFVSKTGVNHHAASTVRGNLAITVFPGAKDAQLKDVVVTEAHGMLRETIGALGKKLDKSKLPPETQLALLDVSDMLKAYKLQASYLTKAFLAAVKEPKEYQSLES